MRQHTTCLQQIIFQRIKSHNFEITTRGSHEPVIAQLVFNLTSKVEIENGGATHNFESGPPKIISTQISEQKILI